MASNATPAGELQLRNYVIRWDRWLRFVQTTTWLPRFVAAALFVALIAAVVSRLRPWLLPGEIALLGVAAFALIGIIGIGILWLYPRPLIESARHFDRLLGLRERTTAALELTSGRIQTNDELRQRQMRDALYHAERARPQISLPLRFERRDWGVALLFAIPLIVLLLLPNPQDNTIVLDDAQQAALAEAAETVREITRDVALDPTLDEVTREQLMQTLESSLEVLEQPGVTPEEAFAALSDAESALRNESEALNQQAQASQAGLEASAQALRDLPTLEEEGQAQSLSDLLARMGVQAGQFGEAERAQAADALNQAAQAAQATDPQLAQRMNEAAQAMQQGDPQQMQQQLDEAQQQAQTSEANQQSAQQASQQMQQNAEQAQQAGQQMNQQGQQQSSQQGQPQPGQQGQQSQDGSQQQSPSAQGSAPQPGDQQAQQGREGQPQAGQQGEQSAQGEASQSNSGQGEGETAAGEQEGGQSSSGSAGSGEGAAQGVVRGAQQGQQPPGENNADGRGETPFESIYAPTRLGQTGAGAEIELESDTSGMPVQEGEFTENPTGQASVPYNEVYGDYADAANRALESDYVPLGLRDLVRDYFTGLEPGR
jgi:hypothetical protein